MLAIMEGLNTLDCKINIYEEHDKLKNLSLVSQGNDLCENN